MSGRCEICGATLAAASAYCSSCGARQGPGAVTPLPVVAGRWTVLLERLSEAVAPRYRVLRLLGYGGMAGVYLAEETRLRRRVAIKVMAPELMVDPTLVARFEQEARTIAQLYHPNIVTVYDVDEGAGLHYFVMAYVPGRTLAHAIASRPGLLPIDVVTHWLYQVGTALAHAHDLGIVHRDVKPGNVLLNTEGSALVTDFGIAKVSDSQGMTKTGMLVGTPMYTSPDYCLTGIATPASDQYSLGVVAYEMLTGRPPFSGPTLATVQAHINDAPPPLSGLRSDCPRAVRTAVERMLAKRAEDRFPDILAAVSAMDAAPLSPSNPFLLEIRAISTATESISVTGMPQTVVEGDVFPLVAEPRDAAGRLLEGRRVNWTSGNSLVAQIDASGRVEAKAPGETWISVSCDEVTWTTPIVISPLPVKCADGAAPAEATPLVAATQGPVAGRSPAYAPAALVASIVVPGTAIRGTPQRELATGEPQSIAGETTRGTPVRAWKGHTRRPRGVVWAAGILLGITAAAGSGLAWWRATHRAAVAVATDARAEQVAGDSPDPSVSEGTMAGIVNPPTAGAGVHSIPPTAPPAEAPEYRNPGTRAEPGTSDEVSSEAAPVVGRLRIEGNIPARSIVTLTAPDGSEQKIRDRDIALPEGAYWLTIRTDGYETARTRVRVVAGSTASWTVALRRTPGGPIADVQKNPGGSPEPTPRTLVRPTSPPDHRPSPDPVASRSSSPQPPVSAVAEPTRTEMDREASARQMLDVVASFVQLLATREVSQVTKLFPGASGAWLQQWKDFLEAPDVRDLQASMSEASPLDVKDDGGQVRFTLQLRWRDYRNAQQSRRFIFRATMRKDGDRWVLSSLDESR